MAACFFMLNSWSAKGEHSKVYFGPIGLGLPLFVSGTLTVHFVFPAYCCWNSFINCYLNHGIITTYFQGCTLRIIGMSTAIMSQSAIRGHSDIGNLGLRLVTRYSIDINIPHVFIYFLIWQIDRFLNMVQIIDTVDNYFLVPGSKVFAINFQWSFIRQSLRWN